MAFFAPYDESRHLISSNPFPNLSGVTLTVRRCPDGDHVVESVYAVTIDAPDEHSSSRADQFDTLRIRFSQQTLPELSWDSMALLWRTPATHCLERHARRIKGKPADWLRSITREAVFAGDILDEPPSDLRVSLLSGPCGPAPLPIGAEWPSCPRCRKPALFSQSLDMRDLQFSRCLPGTTLVVFVCSECHKAGEWVNCSVLIWLPSQIEIQLRCKGEAVPLRQCAQWFGPDNDWKLLDDATYDLLWNQSDPTNVLLCLPTSYGTKIGGVPFYLQDEAVFFDREGEATEYIAQIATPEYIGVGGFGYVSYSARTGETFLEFQDT